MDAMSARLRLALLTLMWLALAAMCFGAGALSGTYTH